MKCAQCEEAEATLRCVDEDLHFCGHCSALLHRKKARRHHEVEPIRAVLVCDECEDALAEVECFQCGGLQTALVFCLPCSATLHSRAARSAHHVGFLNRLKKRGREKSVRGRLVIDLTDSDSDEENQNVDPHVKENVARQIAVKEDAIDCDSEREVLRPWINGKDTTGYSSTRKSPKMITENKNSQSREWEGRLDTVNGLIKLDDEKKVKNEGGPEKRRQRTFAKRSSVKQERHDSREGSCCSNSEKDESDEELGGVHRIKRGTVSLEAFVVEADDQDDGPSGAVPDDKVEAGIKKRIKNMLELGLHPDTPEFEAQQALKNVQRLLTKYNLKQAEVLKGNLTDTSSLVGGMRVVELRAKGKAKQGRMDAWVHELGWVIAENFDCQYFFKSAASSKPLRVVFYGISSNADCAGYAFAATYNRICTMAAAYVACKPFENNEDGAENQDLKLEQVNRGVYTRVARTNYRKGVVAGLKEAVKSAQRMRKENVSSYEKKKMPSGDADEFASCESDGGDDRWASPSAQKEVPYEDDIKRTARMAENCMAITALVLHSQKVGEEFLRQKGIKIRKRTIQSRVAAWNKEAFGQGKKDAKTIDINQKSIRGAKVRNSRVSKD
ncbi:unnamed protein product [Calypogeia fissa]